VTRERMNLWVGIPFRHMGRTRGEGLDCFGLLSLWLKEEMAVDLPLEDELGAVYPVEPREEELNRLRRHLAEYLTYIEEPDLDRLLEGDVLLDEQCHLYVVVLDHELAPKPGGGVRMPAKVITTWRHSGSVCRDFKPRMAMEVYRP